MPSDRVNSLSLALRLPMLALESLGVAAVDRSIAVADHHTIVCANSAALDAGVHVGMPKVKAQMMVDEVLIRDKNKEKNVLKKLAEMMYRFTPDIEFYDSSYHHQRGLLLDISRCLKLFKSSAKLIAAIEQSIISNTSHHYRFGIAHSGPAAWILSYDTYSVTGEETSTLFFERLKKIPINCLLDFPKESDALMKMGFSTLDDVVKQMNFSSINGLLKRFSSEFVRYVAALFNLDLSLFKNIYDAKLDRVFIPDESFCESIEFDYPIASWDLLLSPIDSLLAKLASYIRSRQLQTKKIQWRFYDIYDAVEKLDISSDVAQSGVSFFKQLSMIKLASIDLPFEVDSIELYCQESFALSGISQNLCFNDKRSSSEEFNLVLEKIKVNIGENAVYKVAYHSSHIPEDSIKKVRSSYTINQAPVLLPCRPSLLLSQPKRITFSVERLYWKGGLTLLQGPERIEGNWWENAIARDYYIAEREDHLRCWVFHDLDGDDWYVHGIF